MNPRFEPFFNATFLSLAMTLVACGRGGSVAPKGAAHETVSLGAARIRSGENERVGLDALGARVTPRIAENAPGGVTTNRFWSSLLYPQNDPKNDALSLPLYAHPLVAVAEKRGVGLGYPTRATVTDKEYMFRYAEDLLVAFENAGDTTVRVEGHSDFSVRFSQKESGSSPRTLTTTLTHGVPYAQFELDRPGTIEIWPSEREGKPSVVTSGASARIRYPNRTFVVYSPSGSFVFDGTTLKSDLGGAKRFSVAALPDQRPETLSRFERHAFDFVRDTLVEATISGTNVSSDYRLDVRRIDDSKADSTLVALYPHQWSHLEGETFVGEYASPRGAMRLIEATSFRTETKVRGLLPSPPVAPEDRDEVARLVEKVARGEHFPLGLGETPNHDAYWDGKSLGRLASALHLAKESGADDAFGRLLAALEERLADWFDGEEPRYFQYEPRFRSLVAFPDSYGSATHLNDHHFHYGYFVHAAATIARFDPKWVERYAPMIEALIRDVASPKRNDPLFPRLRFMDPFAGHSWANGPSQFFEGNNEEASSEDINFSYAVALYGAITKKKEYEELGLYLYSTQADAIDEYWFDTKERVFPEGFAHPTVAMVWGAGAKYDTWFDEDPGIIHAINFLPVTGGSYYLGRDPAYVRKNFGTVLAKSHGEITTFRDYLLMFAGLGDPDDAFRRYEEDSLYEPEFGASKAFTFAFLSGLVRYGRPNFDVETGDPYALAFSRNSRTTLVRFSPAAAQKPLSFREISP